jgi:hypothetical protein
MDKEQTAVEWLVEQFENHRATFFKLNDKEERVITLAGRDVIKQAKEMEKEQIINANRDGVDMVVDKKDFISGEQYYKETYGGNK